MVSLRHDLTNLAAEGNQRIKEIQDSQEPVQAKVPQIIAAIHQYRALASITAAKYAGNVLDAMQTVLDSEGTGLSARQFAQAQGLDVGQMFKPPADDEILQDHVLKAMNQHDSPMGLVNGAKLPPEQTPTAPEPPMPLAHNASFQTGSPPMDSSPAATPSPMKLASNAKLPGPQAPPGGPAPAAGPMSTPSAPVRAGGSIPSAPMMSPPSPGLHGANATPFTGTPAAPASPVQPVTPAELVHSFDKGMQAGTPVSATAAGMPPPQPPPEPQAPTTPTAGAGRRLTNHSGASDAGLSS